MTKGLVEGFEMIRFAKKKKKAAVRNCVTHPLKPIGLMISNEGKYLYKPIVLVIIKRMKPVVLKRGTWIQV